MEEISKLLGNILNIDFIRAVISNPKTKEGIIKVKVRPVEKGGELYFQFESFTKTQAFHKNLKADEAGAEFLDHMDSFRQIQIETVEADYTVLVSKKGKVTIKKKKKQEAGKAADLSHDRKKRYIL